MAHSFTDDDEGKKVVNDQGEDVGIIAGVEHGTAYVEPDPGMTDKIKSKLGWNERDEDTYPLQEESIESVTDDEVRLGSADTTGTTGRDTGAGADTGTDTGTTGIGDGNDRVTDDDDDGRR